MRPYTTGAILSSLFFIGVAIFYFLNNHDFYGRLFLLITVISFFGFYYFFKMVYYLRYEATFNEVSFVLLFPLVPFIQTWFKVFLLDNSLTSFDVIIQGETTFLFHVDFIDVLSIPYFFFSLFLVLRVHLRYPFIRLRGHSTDGFNPKLVAFLLFFLIPVVYFIGGFLFYNALFIVFSLCFATVCLLGFFV